MKNKNARINFLIVIIVIMIIIAVTMAISKGYEDSSKKTPTRLINESEETDQSQGKVIKITEEADKIAEQQIEIPDKYKLKEIAKVLFKIDSPAPLNLLIIAGVLSIIFYSLFADIFDAFSPFGKGTSIILSVCITLIASIIGVIKSISVFLINARSHIKFLENYSSLGSFLIVTAIIVFWAIIAGFLKDIKIYKEKLKAKIEGAEAGTGLGFIKELKNAFAKMGRVFTKKP